MKGEMVEWSITAVLKTAVLRGTGGSNPSLSAKKSCKSFDLQDFFFLHSEKVPLEVPKSLLRHFKSSNPFISKKRPFRSVCLCFLGIAILFHRACLAH